MKFYTKVIMLIYIASKEYEVKNAENIQCGVRIKGCRQHDAIISASRNRSCGVFAIMSCYGIMLSLQCIVWNESPTYILIKLCDLIWKQTLYFQRALCAFGYDMACNIIDRLLGDKMHDWAINDDDFLTQKVIYTCLTIGLAKWFIDKWHGVTHKLETCCEQTGSLNPGNEKFKNISMNKSNHNIVEQTWRRINILKPLLNCDHKKFTFALELKKELFNDDRRKYLESKKHTWDNILNYKVINPGFTESLFKHWQNVITLINTNKINGYAIRPTWKEFTMQYNSPQLSNTIPQMTRISFKRKIKRKYKNVWLRNDYDWKIDHLSFDIIESCNQKVFELLKINLKNKDIVESELILMMNNLIKNTITNEWNDIIYNKYISFINIYKGIIEEYIKRFFYEKNSIKTFIKSNLMNSLFGNRHRRKPANFFVKQADILNSRTNYSNWKQKYCNRIQLKKENDYYHKTLADIQNLVDMKQSDEYFFWFFPHGL